jgi:hypothetical protein
MSKGLGQRKWWSGDCYLVCPLYEGALLLYETAETVNLHRWA